MDQAVHDEPDECCREGQSFLLDTVVEIRFSHDTLGGIMWAEKEDRFHDTSFLRQLAGAKITAIAILSNHGYIIDKEKPPVKWKVGEEMG